MTLATSNTGSVASAHARKAASKKAAGQNAQRVTGPRLMHAAAEFTPVTVAGSPSASVGRAQDGGAAQVWASSMGHGVNRRKERVMLACVALPCEEGRAPMSQLADLGIRITGEEVHSVRSCSVTELATRWELALHSRS